jgi:hypothetical protein
MSWDSRFPEPIELPDGVKLASLREAIVHLVNTVPSFERGMPVVLTAAELITCAAERGGPIEFARIATLRALNRHEEGVLNPDILKSRISTSFRATETEYSLSTSPFRGIPAGLNRRANVADLSPHLHSELRTMNLRHIVVTD